ncbi:MAG: histidine phosphatase family protein [Patescibacteria group bacterium]|jgi:broad specificity phosphatase PhoE|nr:histidine phosphatase family protein [Patescibacteria group bacterium]
MPKNCPTPYSKTQSKRKSPFTEILLIRHCNPDYNQQDKLGDNMPLSKNGKTQRKHLTERLIKMKIDKVYTSDIRRAKETAVLYLKKTKSEACIEEGLNEIHWSHWVNIKYFNMSEDLRKKKFKGHKRLDKQLDKIQADVRPVIAQIYKENKGKKVAIFSHGNFIKSLLTGILNADIIGFLSMEIFQSSISKIIIDDDGYIKISFVNDVNHLPRPPKKDLFITLANSEYK